MLKYASGRGTFFVLPKNVTKAGLVRSDEGAKSNSDAKIKVRASFYRRDGIETPPLTSHPHHLRPSPGITPY